MTLPDAGVEIIDPLHSPLRENFAQEYFELRKHKGMTMDIARDRMLEVSYFGTMMVRRGMAGGMVSGAIHTTANTNRPAFEFIKTRPGVDVVSSVFLMCLKTGVLVYGDCAVIPKLRKPVNDLSRGCTVADIVNTVAITAIQAQATSGKLE